MALVQILGVAYSDMEEKQQQQLVICTVALFALCAVLCCCGGSRRRGSSSSSSVSEAKCCVNQEGQALLKVEEAPNEPMPYEHHEAPVPKKLWQLEVEAEEQQQTFTYRRQQQGKEEEPEAEQQEELLFGLQAPKPKKDVKDKEAMTSPENFVLEVKVGYVSGLDAQTEVRLFCKCQSSSTRSFRTKAATSSDGKVTWNQKKFIRAEQDDLLQVSLLGYLNRVLSTLGTTDLGFEGWKDGYEGMLSCESEKYKNLAIHLRVLVLTGTTRNDAEAALCDEAVASV